MRQALWTIAAVLLAGCAEDAGLWRPDPLPGIVVSSEEAAPVCTPVQSVEVRAGHRDPTTHELLRAFAAQRGANYVVLDASAVVAGAEDIVVVAFARLFRCPITLYCERCTASLPLARGPVGLR